MASIGGFFKALAPIAASFIPGIGPMVGPALGAALSNTGSVLGHAAGGQADAQQARAGLENQRNQLLNQQYGTQQGAEMSQGQLDLQRQQFDDQTESSRLRRALVGQLLGTTQDFSLDVPGIPKAQTSGGFNFSALGPEGRDIGAEMVTRALSQLREGNTYQGGNVLTPPELSEVGDVGGNGFLNAAALATSTLGALGSGGQLGGGQQRDYTKLLPITNQMPNLGPSVGLPPPPGSR